MAEKRTKADKALRQGSPTSRVNECNGLFATESHIAEKKQGSDKGSYAAQMEEQIIQILRVQDAETVFDSSRRITQSLRVVPGERTTRS
jgi:hypothetical protein